MLVLSRSVDEAIQIGNDVRITVIQIRGDKVRIGIEAPDTTPVHRREVFEKIVDSGEANHPGGKLARCGNAE